MGLDSLLDDRDERPGVKFKDADLIGIPYRNKAPSPCCSGKFGKVAYTRASSWHNPRRAGSAIRFLSGPVRPYPR